MSVYQSQLADEAATHGFAAHLAAALTGAGGVIHLRGDLGAGKTSLVRGLLQALGYAGRVVSPTYTLIEPYDLPSGQRVFHLDLYRVADPGELAMLGLRDINLQRDLVLVEWPEQGGAELPAADLLLRLADADSGPGRRLEMEAVTALGGDWLTRLQAG